MQQSFRSHAITPDAKFIGAGTFGGDVLLFKKESNLPIEQIKINSAIGAFDLSDDASIFLTGSADKKVRIFHKGEGRVRTEIELNEYVGEIDLSANGQYAVAGTSGAVYFFESLVDLNNTSVSNCTQIIEPPPDESGIFTNQNNINQPVRDDDQMKTDFFIQPEIILISFLIILANSLTVYYVIKKNVQK